MFCKVKRSAARVQVFPTSSILMLQMMLESVTDVLVVHHALAARLLPLEEGHEGPLRRVGEMRLAVQERRRRGEEQEQEQE